MTDVMIIQIFQQTLYVLTLLAGPPLLTMIVVGLASQILQTVTQLKDQSLSFIPKVGITAIVMLILLPWYIETIRQYFEFIFSFVRQGAM